MKNFINKLLLLVLFLGNTLNISPLVHAATSTSAVQFVDNVTLATSNGPITSNKISDASLVNSTYTLNIPNGEVLDTSQPYTMPLPPELKPTTSAPIQLTKPDGTLLGEVTVQNNVISIMFEPVINSLSNRVLYFNFWSAFNKDTLNYDVGNNLIFPTKTNPNNSIHVNFSKSSSGEGSGTSAVAKTLRYEANNIVTWTVTINNGGYSVANANFFDTMSNTQDYVPGSTTIHYRNYKNTVIRSETTDLAFYSNSDGSKSTSLNFGRLYGDVEASLTETNSIVIHYQTKMTFNPLNNKYPNHASTYDGDTIIDSVVSTATYHGQGGGGTGDPAGDVTVKYVDESGNKLSDDVVLTGNIGQNYNSEQKTIDGYTFKEVQGNPTGSFTDQAQTVTYVYTKTPAGAVTVSYVDESGNKLSDDVVLTGNIGENYNSEQKTIDGYTFKEVQGNPTGSFTDQAQTVTYVYTKTPAGNVTVSYVDESGNKLSDDVVLTGNIGENYNSEQKTIDGYTFKEVQGNPTGSFTDQEQVVTYVYSKVPVKAGDVTVKHTDEEGNKIAEDTVLTGNIGDRYTIKEKDIPGYTVKEVRGNLSGVFTEKEQEISYIYAEDKVFQLPATGDDSGKFLSIIGLILLVMVGGIIYFVRKFKKNDVEK
ncbi:MucBP domain-containing protein [Lactococcus garvieae]|uniref:MucBP domain-containing protein n=1 Tax=Lactococcus garvieae TaxID=1363 RepID=UPI0009BFAD0C|nr:MucBP domain-containing protein [Lactococcus garvieae]